LFIVFLSIFSINAQGWFKQKKEYINCTLDSWDYHGSILCIQSYFFPGYYFGTLKGLGKIDGPFCTSDYLYINGHGGYASFRAFFIGFTGDVRTDTCISPPFDMVAIHGTAKYVLIFY
jgi:hypothetical protein